MTDANQLPEPVPEYVLDLIGSQFLEAARYLREIQDERLVLFVPTAKYMKIGLRKAYALAQIDRTYHDIGIERDRLRRIGWTKLAMLAPYITEENVEQLLLIAEKAPSHAVKRMLQGQEINPDSRVVALYLQPEELAIYNLAMERFGAVKHAKGWVNKEAALIAALNAALKA